MALENPVVEVVEQRQKLACAEGTRRKRETATATSLSKLTLGPAVW
jgi:hypothetical protein